LTSTTDLLEEILELQTTNNNSGANMNRHGRRKFEVPNKPTPAPKMPPVRQTRPIDPKDVTILKCDNCNGEIFYKIFKVARVSSLAGSNTTGVVLTQEIPAGLVCSGCGQKFGGPKPKVDNPDGKEPG